MNRIGVGTGTGSVDIGEMKTRYIRGVLSGESSQAEDDRQENTTQNWGNVYSPDLTRRTTRCKG